jgi:hypothetical protein
MRTLSLAVLVVLTAACAYPRRTTLMHSAPADIPPQTQPDHLWSIRLIDAQLPELKGGGLAWDSDGTPPDPFVRLVINGHVIWESPVQKNTRHPVWNATLPRNIYVPPQASFRIELWDEDTGANDPAGVLMTRGLPETALPDALAHLALGNGGTVTLIVSTPIALQGVGISFEQHSDALVVLTVEPFSPAARAGIQIGDRIVAIGDNPVERLTPAKAASELSLSVDRGSTLTVSDGRNKPRQVTLDRDYLWLTM